MTWAWNWRVLEVGAAWILVAKKTRKEEMMKAFIVDAWSIDGVIVSCFGKRLNIE